MLPPIHHIVLFKFKPTSTAEDIKNCFLQLFALSQSMPEIKSFRWGKYQSNEGLNQGFTHAFMMTFDSEQDRDTYLTHAAHVKVAQFINLHLDNFPQGVIAFDSPFAENNFSEATRPQRR